VHCPSHAASELAAFDPQIPPASQAQAQGDGAQCGWHFGEAVVNSAVNGSVQELLEGQVLGWEV